MSRIVQPIPIGSSKGLRLPHVLRDKYGLGDGVVVEERPDGIFVRPVVSDARLSWEETFREMGAAKEDWSDWEGVTADGLESD